jgi:hypothetical protein
MPRLLPSYLEQSFLVEHILFVSEQADVHPLILSKVVPLPLFVVQVLAVFGKPKLLCV